MKVVKQASVLVARNANGTPVRIEFVRRRAKLAWALAYIDKTSFASILQRIEEQKNG